jgi:hypothetical protein
MTFPPEPRLKRKAELAIANATQSRSEQSEFLDLIKTPLYDYRVVLDHMITL